MVFLLLLLLAFCFIFLVLWFLFCCCLFCSFFKKSHQPQSQKNLEEFIPDEAVPFLSVEDLLQLMLRAILAPFLLYWSYYITPHPVPLEFVDSLQLLSNSWQRSPAACCEGLGEPSAWQEYLCGGLSGLSGSLWQNSTLAWVWQQAGWLRHTFCVPRSTFPFTRGISLIETYWLYPTASSEGMCPLGQLSELRKSWSCFAKTGWRNDELASGLLLFCPAPLAAHGRLFFLIKREIYLRHTFTFSFLHLFFPPACTASDGISRA